MHTFLIGICVCVCACAHMVWWHLTLLHSLLHSNITYHFLTFYFLVCKECLCILWVSAVLHCVCVHVMRAIRCSSCKVTVLSSLLACFLGSFQHDLWWKMLFKVCPSAVVRRLLLCLASVASFLGRGRGMSSCLLSFGSAGRDRWMTVGSGVALVFSTPRLRVVLSSCTFSSIVPSPAWLGGLDSRLLELVKRHDISPCIVVRDFFSDVSATVTSLLPCRSALAFAVAFAGNAGPFWHVTVICSEYPAARSAAMVSTAVRGFVVDPGVLCVVSGWSAVMMSSCLPSVTSPVTGIDGFIVGPRIWGWEQQLSCCL